MKFKTIHHLRRAAYLQARNWGATTKEASTIAETTKENAIRNTDGTWTMKIKDANETA